MKTSLTIHSDEKEMVACMRKVQESAISERNKEIILDLCNTAISEGLTKLRVAKIAYTCRLLAELLEMDFDKAGKKEIEALVRKLHQRSYEAWTIYAYKVILKKLYKWLKGNNEIYPEEVRWIKPRIERNKMKLPSEGDLLAEEEVKRLIATAHHPRDKAFVSVLYESGCRIGEVAGLKISNIAFDEHGCVIVVKGKTGSRKIRLIASTGYLATWLNNHPCRDSRESYLWTGIGRKNDTCPIRYDGIWSLLKRLAKEAGINKRIHPHLFRHSRATFMANHLTEFQMNQYFGWIQGSGMPSTYVHLSGREIDGAILALNGIKTEQHTQESILKPQNCFRCQYINTVDAKYCTRCGLPLTKEQEVSIQREHLDKGEAISALMDKLVMDKEIAALLAKKIYESGLKDMVKSLS